jgi:putative ABC transport system permease protein
VVNETAVKNFGLESPEKAIGEPVHWNIWGEDSIKRGTIIGVVEDFNYKSLHNEISNTVLHIGPQYFSYMVLRLSPGDLSATLSNIEKAYRKFEPTRPFDYQFVDQSFDQFYKSEEKLSQLFSIFTSLAIVTAAIGLFGLVSFSVVNRAREISIRKVLGAATTTIFIMLVQRYFIMIALCLLIAVPLSWYIAREWLTNFAYHTNIEALVFVEVGFIIFVLTLVTVGYHAIKGASANPSEKLRTD